MHELGMFLKFLSGEQLSQEEIEILSYSNIFLYLVDSSMPILELDNNIIEPSITWLSNVVNQCGYSTPKITQGTYPAAFNLLRIANRIKLLESFYEEARQMCAGLENTLQGYGIRLAGRPRWIESGLQLGQMEMPLTFNETMNEIGIYLRYLSGQSLTEKENESPLTELRREFATDIKTTGRLDTNERIESILHWLYNHLNKCRQVQSGIVTAQQLQLENLYSPTGQIAQQAGQRFYGTAQQQRY